MKKVDELRSFIKKHSNPSCYETIDSLDQFEADTVNGFITEEIKRDRNFMINGISRNDQNTIIELQDVISLFIKRY